MIKEFNIFYPIDIYIGVDETKEDFENTYITIDNCDYLKNQIQTRKDIDGFAVLVNTQKENPGVAVFIHLDRDSLYDLSHILTIDSTIVHEAYHACNIIYKYIEATPDVDNDEPFAYLLSYVYKCCTDTMNEYKQSLKTNNNE